jgi:thioredoxin-like negative regulator of GroEL
MSEKHTDVAFGKVDIDDNADAATEHQINSVPTFIFFNGEDAVERFSGADPGQLQTLIEDLESR